jgi:hypothetical protein
VSKTSSIIGEAFLGVAAIGLAPFTGGASLALYGLGASLLLGAAAQALAPAPQLGTGAGGGQSAATVGIQGPVPAERMVFGTTGVKGTPGMVSAFEPTRSPGQARPRVRADPLHPDPSSRARRPLAMWVQGHRESRWSQHTGWISYFPPTGLVADPGGQVPRQHPRPLGAGRRQRRLLAVADQPLRRRLGRQPHAHRHQRTPGRRWCSTRCCGPSRKLDLTFELQGHRLWDPRTGVVAFSRNPALAWLHALTGVHGPRGGISMDLVNLDSVIAAANVCDEQLTKKDGTVVPRYAIDGTWDTTEDFENVEQQILATMAGTRVKSGATYYLYAGAARPLVADLTTDDLAGVYSISPKRDRAGLYNTSKALWVNAEKGFADAETPSYPPVAGIQFTVLEARNAAGLALQVVNSAGVVIGVQGPSFQLLGNPYQFQDGGQILVHELQLRGVSSSEQAQRLVKIDLEQHRRQVTWSAAFKPRALLLKPMDMVTFTDPALGWDHERFLVVGWERTEIGDALAVNLSFAAYDSAVWAWDPSEEQDEAGTGGAVLPDLSAVIPLLIDGPALTYDATQDWGFYAAYVATDATKPTAPARLYRGPTATDEPDPVLYLPRPATAGLCSSILPGGDVGYVDTGASLRLTLYPQGAALTPAGAFEIANMENLAWVGPVSGKGGEIVQFETAVNTSGRAWTIGGLRRGLFGTEDRIGTHGSGEMFVLMDDRVGRVPDSTADLDKPLWYWVAYEGRPPDWLAAPGVQFANNGESRRPLPPVHVAMVRSAAGDLLVTWEPRTRGFVGTTGGPQLVEDRWEFRITVYKAGNPVSGYPISVFDQPFQWLYPLAQQRADLGAPATTLDIGIKQRSGGFGTGDETRGVLRVSGTF